MNRASSKSVERELKTLANEEVEPFHFERTMANVKSQLREGKGKMTLLKKTSIVSGIAITILLALILIPASYSVTVGSLVEADFMMPTSPVKAIWTDDSGETTDITGMDFEFKDIFAALEGIEGIDNQNMTIDNGKASLSFVTSQRSGEDIKSAVHRALSGVMGTNANLNVKCKEIRQLRGGNALAAISGGKICIGLDAMPDAEIRAMLTSALEAHGMQIQSVDVQTSEHNGEINREIRIMGELPEGMSVEDFEIDGFLESLHGGNAAGEGDKKVIIIKRHMDTE